MACSCRLPIGAFVYSNSSLHDDDDDDSGDGDDDDL